MNSVERVLRRRGDLLLGLWSVRATLVFLLVGIGSMEVSGAADSGPLATWSTLGFTALFATIGFSAARPSTAATWRASMIRRLRFGLPPFLLVVLLCVAVLGPLVTSLALRDYLTDPDSWAYLLNLVGVPHYRLPGVFDFNNVAEVNAITWAAPFYLVVIAIASLRSPRRLVRAVPATLAAALALGSLLAEALDLLPGGSRDLAVVALRGYGAAALLGGLLGAAAYQAGRWVPIDGRLAVLAAAVVAVAAMKGDAAGQAAPLLRVGAAVPMTYLVIYLSLRPLPYAPIARALAPFLPGLLLFSYPLQQLAIQLGPRPQGAGVNLLLGGSAALLLAWLYWWAVGRRIVGRPLAPKTTGVSPGRSVRRSVRSIRQVRPQAAFGYLAATVLIAASFLGLLWMVYVAMQPDPGGM